MMVTLCVIFCVSTIIVVKCILPGLHLCSSFCYNDFLLLHYLHNYHLKKINLLFYCANAANLINEVMSILQILDYYQIFTVTEDLVINLFVQKVFLSTSFYYFLETNYQESLVQEV